jgi:hypothetical protein
MPDDQPTHKLVIQNVYKLPARLKFLERVIASPIQNKVFTFGLKIRNINNVPYPGGVISSIKYLSAEGKTIVHTCTNSFNIPSLDPNRERIVWLENGKTNLCGLGWIDCTLLANDNKSTLAFQYDDANKETCLNGKVDSWGGSFYIVSQFEKQQSVTNILLVVLTILTFIHGVWGLSNFFKGILIFLQYVVSICDFLISKLMESLASSSIIANK